MSLLARVAQRSLVRCASSSAASPTSLYQFTDEEVRRGAANVVAAAH
jgi:hypothetical protein